METASREDGDQAMPVPGLDFHVPFQDPLPAGKVVWWAQEGECRHQKAAQRGVKEPSAASQKVGLCTALPPSGTAPQPQSRKSTWETWPSPHLGKGAVLATLRDKHGLLGLLGLLEGLSPLQATLALASV